MSFVVLAFVSLLVAITSTLAADDYGDSHHDYEPPLFEWVKARCGDNERPVMAVRADIFCLQQSSDEFEHLSQQPADVVRHGCLPAALTCGGDDGANYVKFITTKSSPPNTRPLYVIWDCIPEGYVEVQDFTCPTLERHCSVFPDTIVRDKAGCNTCGCLCNERICSEFACTKKDCRTNTARWVPPPPPPPLVPHKVVRYDCQHDGYDFTPFIRTDGVDSCSDDWHGADSAGYHYRFNICSTTTRAYFGSRDCTAGGVAYQLLTQCVCNIAMASPTPVWATYPDQSVVTLTYEEGGRFCNSIDSVGSVTFKFVCDHGMPAATPLPSHIFEVDEPPLSCNYTVTIPTPIVCPSSPIAEK